MKKIILIIIALLFYSQIKAQWSEFNYFVIKAGISNQFLTPAPSSANGLFIKTYEGDLALMPDNKYFKYNQGFNIGLNFHFDWHNDMGGFIIGTEYYNFAVSNKFVTDKDNYYIIRTFTVHSVSFPLMVKFGYEIFNLQRYAFVGLRLNWNLRMELSEVASWNSIPQRQTYTNNSDLFQIYNTVLVAGINFLFFNIEADFMPHSFLNKEYSINAGTEANPFIIKPFSSYPDYTFLINTTIYIPLSPWTGTRSYFLNKIARMF